jgi:hypothetical protein
VQIRLSELCVFHVHLYSGSVDLKRDSSRSVKGLNIVATLGRGYSSGRPKQGASVIDAVETIGVIVKAAPKHQQSSVFARVEREWHVGTGPPSEPVRLIMVTGSRSINRPDKDTGVGRL